MKKLLTIVGAHPQFIKASVVSRAIAQTTDLHEVLVHTGQNLEVGANTLVGADAVAIQDAVGANLGRLVTAEGQLYGGAMAAQRVAQVLTGGALA